MGAVPPLPGAEAATGSLLDRFHYMTLYLLRDEQLVPEFFALAEGAGRQGPVLPGPARPVVGALPGGGALGRAHGWRCRPEAVPFRPADGVHVVVGPPVDGEELVEHHGVAGAWQFTDAEHERTITVAFVDGDLWQASALPWERPARSHPNGRAHWSELMPSAGIGSLR